MSLFVVLPVLLLGPPAQASANDGSFSYRDVSVVTYVVDFVDPALADYEGRGAEVNHYGSSWTASSSRQTGCP